jgi:hypothetical protein
MLRILQGYALPGSDWEGWTVHVDTLTAPNGRHFTASELQHLEQIFGMARLWRKEYPRPAAERPQRSEDAQEAAGAVLPFPGIKRAPVEAQEPPQAQIHHIGGTR